MTDEPLSRLFSIGMLQRLETSVIRQRKFTSDAGHELKSPVTTLLTMAEVAEANPGAFSVADLAADVAGQGRRLATLVDDLLILARTDEHRLELNRESIDLAVVTHDIIAANGPAFAFIDTGQVASTFVFADPRRMGQVVRNLLDNAARHTARTVRVGTRTAAVRPSSTLPTTVLASRPTIARRLG